MNGVEVLNTIQGREVNAVLIAFAIAFAICAFILPLNDYEILVILCISLFATCLLMSLSQKTQYEVVISDNVSFEEFNNKYKVIKQEGDIFTVEMREDDD